MRVHKDRKHVSFYALPEIKAALKRAALRLSEVAPEVTVDENGRYDNTHHLEALVCWLLTRPHDVQDRIILEGRGISLKLSQFPQPVKDFPDAYKAAPSVPAPESDLERGHETIGRATSPPDIVARHAGGSAGGPGRKKKRAKPKRSPGAGVGQ